MYSAQIGCSAPTPPPTPRIPSAGKVFKPIPLIQLLVSWLETGRDWLHRPNINCPETLLHPYPHHIQCSWMWWHFSSSLNCLKKLIRYLKDHFKGVSVFNFFFLLFIIKKKTWWSAISAEILHSHYWDHWALAYITRLSTHCNWINFPGCLSSHLIY